VRGISFDVRLYSSEKSTSLLKKRKLIIKERLDGMSRYLFIETRDPFESRDTQFTAETAVTLKQRGNEVIVFLVQNGVLAARKGARFSHLPLLVEAEITLLVDDFSLRERGIDIPDLIDGAIESHIDSLVDFLAQANTKVIWH
jgi:hypothetical protein